MRSLYILSALLASLSGAAAQHVHYRIPQVENIVHSMTEAFGPWATYHGPKGYHWPTGRPTRTKGPGPAPTATCGYWLENIQHQGISAFNPDPNYQVFRNVKDFGAKGDGVSDDTAAINLAISSGGRCAPGVCQSSTVSPAIVYFPPGTYVVTASIIDYYYTQLIGNPNCMPTIRAAANFTGGLGMIDADPYGANGLSYGSTNVFFRQIRNLILDLTEVPANSAMTGIHWPTAQATSLQNLIFLMSSANGTQHQGIFIESGSGGFMTDLTFYGGLNGAVFGNQQFTMRNLTFYNAVTAINQIWDWGWTYENINIYNCSVGLNMSSGGATAQSVGSVTFIDSSITNTAIGILTAFSSTSQPPSGGSLIVENTQFNNVPVAIQGVNGVALAGTTGSLTVTAWGQGHAYTPTGPNFFQGPITPNDRPGSLVQGGKYYQRSKPQYQDLPVQRFISARSAGARGDGRTDDSDALQGAILAAARQRKVLFIDSGTYRVTKTIYIPPNAQIVGETYPIIMSSGDFFNDINQPQPVVRVGLDGESGSVELSDFVVSTQGQQQGAILIEYNLASSGTPAGMWDVHNRIGGFAGSNLQVPQCPTTPTVATPPAPVNSACIAAYMSMHITKSATGLYMENNWIWTADHDQDDPANNNTQITIYAGRGLYIESTQGIFWLYGTAVEHHVLYEYQLANTQNIFMGQIQTETAYYQPNPNATIPFPAVAAINDPVFPAATSNSTGNNADGWGLRVLDSQNILVYGAGLYSFFNNWSTTCSANQSNACQTQIFSVEGTSAVSVYNLNTVGTACMITLNGVCVAQAADNLGNFIDTIALFRTS